MQCLDFSKYLHISQKNIYIISVVLKFSSQQTSLSISSLYQVQWDRWTDSHQLFSEKTSTDKVFKLDPKFYWAHKWLLIMAIRSFKDTKKIHVVNFIHINKYMLKPE